MKNRRLALELEAEAEIGAEALNSSKCERCSDLDGQGRKVVTVLSCIEDGPRAPKAGPLIMDKRVVVLEPARPLINSRALLAEVGTAELGNQLPGDVASAKADGRVKEAPP